MVPSIEEVSSSLVREYLSRKGMKKTLACMEEELPRTEASINNRAQLRQMLSIENLYRNNKVQNSPLKTLLEIIVKHHMEQLNKINESNFPQSASVAKMIFKTLSQTPTVISGSKAEESTPGLDNCKPTKLRSDGQETCVSQSINKSQFQEKCRLSSHSQTDLLSFDLKDQSSAAFLQDSESVIQREPDKNASVLEAPQRSRINRVRRGMMAGPIPQESNRKRHSRKAEVSQSLLRKEEENRPSRDGLLLTGLLQKSLENSQTVISPSECEGEKEDVLSRLVNTDFENTVETLQQSKAKTKRVKIKSKVADLNLSELSLDDVDDDEKLSEFSKGSLLTTPAEHSFGSQPMDQLTAMELKAVLLGSSLNCFSAEWRNQGFTFSERFDLRYGIVQKKGGPCGVLASVQAFALKILLFETTDVYNNLLQLLKPSNATRRRCLVLAMTEILWRAGEENQAKIAINSGRTQFGPTKQYKCDGVLEKVTCFTVDNIKDLQFLLEQHIEQFETGMLGCLLLTISAVLSRSIEKVREDMDVPTAPLIGAHGYCTQELVNLLLCGRSVSNVFDNEMDLDSGNGNVTLLKGIKSQCDVGFLSLFEHYNICKVGAHLKSPRYPIWVVCSESHFSVLFGLQRELLTYEDEGLEFDLYYYDGLANQQEEIRLTVSPGKMTSGIPDDDTDLIPPLDLCIRTRWKEASVNWNDTEPIL